MAERVRTHHLLALLHLYTDAARIVARISRSAFEILVDEPRRRVAFWRVAAGWRCSLDSDRRVLVTHDEIVELLEELWPITEQKAEEWARSVGPMTDEDEEMLADLKRRLGLQDEGVGDV